MYELRVRFSLLPGFVLDKVSDIKEFKNKIIIILFYKNGNTKPMAWSSF